MVTFRPIPALHSLLTGLFLLCGIFLSAQNLAISSTADTISSDEQFIIALDGELGNFSNFATLPDVPGLVIISHSESFNYNASHKNAKVHQSYVMKAITPGDYTIGPAWIQAGTRRIYSNTIHLHVKAGDSPIGSGIVFLRCEPVKKNAYAGEKLTVYVRVYFSNDVYVSGDYPLANSYSGFWRGNDASYSYDNNDVRYDDTTVMIRGKSFTRRTLMKETLYPNAIGDLQLPTYTYSCYITPGRSDHYTYDSYDMSFDVVSEQNTITVLPLPDHDSLPGYSGDVGTFNTSSSISSDSTNAWEPVILTMWVTGEGNFQLMMPPALTLPPQLRVQNSLSTDTNMWIGNKKTPAKMFRYLITPEQEGDYVLPGIPFSYFDPKKKEYVTVYSDTFQLHVAPAVKIESDTVSNLPDTFFTKAKKKNTMLIVTICVVLLGGTLLGFIITRRRKKKRLEEETKKAQLAGQEEMPEYIPPPDTSREQANALVYGAGQYLQNGMVPQSLNNLYEALVIRISGVTKMRREEISVNTLRYRLRLAKISDEIINEIIEHYEDLKLKRYTLSSADGAAAHVLIVRTADLLRKIA